MRKAIVLVTVLLALSSLVLIPLTSAVADSWSEKAPMPFGSYFLGAATVNGKIYAIGGSFSSSGFNTTQEYNPSTDTWVAKAPVPTRLPNRTDLSIQSAGIVACQSKVYVIGGIEDMGVFSDTNRVYDPSTDSWAIKSPLPRVTNEAAAASLGGKIYIIAGIGNGLFSSSIYNYTEIYDPSTNSWSNGDSIPVPVRDAACAIANSKIYVIGGQTNSTFACNLVQIYDPKNDTWSFGQPIPTGVSDAGAASTSGNSAPVKIYVIGGSNQPNVGLSITQVYDPTSNTWTEGASMPTARFGLAIATVNDALYAIGGYQITGTSSDTYGNNEEYLPLGYGTVPELPIWGVIAVFLAASTLVTSVIRRKKFILG